MSSSKKIIRLFSRLNIGGPALHVVNLSVGLREFGYETLLVVGRADESEGTLEDYAVSQGTEMVVLPTFQAAISPWKDLVTLYRLIRLMRRERPDIVHTHTFKAGLLGRMAARLTGVPVVVHTFHGHLFNGYGNPLKARFLKKIEAWLAHSTDRVIAVSAQVAKDLVDLKVAKKTQVDVIELGFNMAKIEQDFMRAPSLRLDLKIDQSAKVVGIVGRLVPVKNVELFLEALCPLLEEHSELHLAILGDGKERSKLEKLAATLSRRSDRIHFTGWRRPATSDLADLDLCVCSSKNEGTSVSVIEAVMAGVPVISTRVGGMEDLLENGKWGALVESTPTALRAAVRDRLFSKPEVESLKAGAEYFRARFSLPRLLQDVHSSYQGVDHHA